MTEEEKKAIEWLKNATFFSARIYAPSILNLIEKQQKEIEELEVCLQAEEKYAEGLNNDIKSLLNIEPNNNFISKDRIKKILGIESNVNIEFYLKYLVAENERLEDIEDDRDCNYVSKDKIREKIKELEKNNKRIEKQFKGGSQNLLQNYIENIAQIKILKQLLDDKN